MKVKIFSESIPETLEDEINEWLMQANTKVLGIHYATANRFETNLPRIFSVLISYEE